MSEKKSNFFKLTRRSFLKLGTWAAGLAASWGIFRFLSYQEPAEESISQVTLQPAIEYPVGTKLYVAEVKAWLIRDENGFYAVSSICTHLGCTVKLEDDQFNCPCHGSQYDLSSAVIKGPATKALPHFGLSLTEAGELVIDSSVIVPSTDKLKP